MSEINYVCSLGGLCHSSQILKRNNLKFVSYPFDWIFSNCDNIVHCIEDNFKIFLDKSYYRGHGSKCEHTFYKKIGANMFNHFNPLDNIDHYNYYVRCVDRFKSLIEKQEHKLFIMIFVNIETHDKNEIIIFNDKFSKYASNYTLLIIHHVPNKQVNHHIFTYNGDIHFLELHTLSVSNGVQFGKEDDNIYLDNIIKSKYNFNVKNIIPSF